MRSPKLKNIEGARIIINSMLSSSDKIQIVHLDSCNRGMRRTNVVVCGNASVRYEDGTLLIEDISEDIYTSIPIIYVTQVTIAKDNKGVFIKWIDILEGHDYTERGVIVRVRKDTIMPTDPEHGFGYNDWPDNIPALWRDHVLRDWYKLTQAQGVRIPFAIDDVTVKLADSFVETYNQGKPAEEKICSPAKVYCSGRYI